MGSGSLGLHWTKSTWYRLVNCHFDCLPGHVLFLLRYCCDNRWLERSAACLDAVVCGCAWVLRRVIWFLDIRCSVERILKWLTHYCVLASEYGQPIGRPLMVNALSILHSRLRAHPIHPRVGRRQSKHFARNQNPGCHCHCFAATGTVGGGIGKQMLPRTTGNCRALFDRIGFKGFAALRAGNCRGSKIKLRYWKQWGG